MNIYDFDNTIYDGDTNKDIIKFGLKKHFSKTYKALKKAKQLQKDYKIGLIEFERVKETMLSFLFEIEDQEKFINEFVDKHMHKIKAWYKTKQSQNDIIISASYELWIKEFARRLKIKEVIATRVDSEGKILGKNCKGEEKVRRLKQLYPDAQILTSYADEESDLPILRVAQTAFVVNKNKLIQYSSNYKFKK